ncbi:MAG TPA: CHASE3 domain-containing protein, partial [Longimicrobiales bacterium]|nr:CHASE3 domain-containing protein [Longimicrobiales bacterium]
MPASAPAEQAELVSARSTLIPLGFVILALLMLALIPVLMQSRTREARALATEEIQPARRQLAVIQLALAREMSGLRGFLLTGEPLFLEQYVERRQAEERAFQQLKTHVQHLGPNVIERAEALQRTTARWHASVDETGIVQRQVVPPAFIERIPYEESLYVSALAAAARLDQAIDRREDAHRAAIQRADEQQLLLTV